MPEIRYYDYFWSIHLHIPSVTNVSKAADQDASHSRYASLLTCTHAERTHHLYPAGHWNTYSPVAQQHRAPPRLDVSTCHTTAQRPLPRQYALTSVLQQMPMIIISRGSTGPHTSVPSSSRISNVLTTPTAHKNCWLTPQRHLSWLMQAQNNVSTLAFVSLVAQAHRNITQ